jgi:hypothetical protein
MAPFGRKIPAREAPLGRFRARLSEGHASGGSRFINHPLTQFGPAHPRVTFAVKVAPAGTFSRAGRVHERAVKSGFVCPRSVMIGSELYAKQPLRAEPGTLTSLRGFSCARMRCPPARRKTAGKTIQSDVVAN